MYALVKIAGRQYRVSPGDKVKVDRLATDPGDETVVNDVMMIADNDNVKVGAPVIDGASVTVATVSHGRHRKVTAYHFKRRGGMRKTHGHKQHFTLVEVKSIHQEG